MVYLAELLVVMTDGLKIVRIRARNVLRTRTQALRRRRVSRISYGGKTIPRWRTAAILKIDISPYLSEKSSDFHDVIKNEKVAFDRLRV